MSKLLYFMPVSWGWIKQRPHFIAEELNKYCDLTIAEKKEQTSASNRQSTPEPKDLKIVKYGSFPRYNPIKRHISILNVINLVLFVLRIRIRQYDTIWLSSIKQYVLLRKLIPESAKVIFDCMDDELSFPNIVNNPKAVKRAANIEKQLVERADYIICSSNNLKETIIKRTNIEKEILIANNATIFPNRNIIANTIRKESDDKTKSLVYIGTIAKWFDFKSVLALLDSDDNVVLQLWGPIDCEIPKHDRIQIKGVCKHEDIWRIMVESDALIMPFTINQLILSVNPVKLYEYIWSGKPVISIEYPESLYFSDFVYYYRDSESLIEQYRTLKSNGFKAKCQDTSRIQDFTNNNSWVSRVKSVVEYIKL